MTKGWRTLLIAIVTALFGVLEAFDWTQILQGKNAGFVIAGIGIVFAWLRTVTNTALGKKE